MEVRGPVFFKNLRGFLISYVLMNFFIDFKLVSSVLFISGIVYGLYLC